MRVCASVYPRFASLAVNYVGDGLGPTDEQPGLRNLRSASISSIESGVTSAIQERHKYAIIKHWKIHP